MCQWFSYNSSRTLLLSPYILRKQHETWYSIQKLSLFYIVFWTYWIFILRHQNNFHCWLFYPHPWIWDCNKLNTILSLQNYYKYIKYIWDLDNLSFLKYQCIITTCKHFPENVSHSVMSDSLWFHGLWPTRLLCPWKSPARILEWATISQKKEAIFPSWWYGLLKLNI